MLLTVDPKMFRVRQCSPYWLINQHNQGQRGGLTELTQVMRINKDLRNLTGYEGELLISGRAKARAHSFLSSSFKKYMYEADEGPIEPPLQPKGPVVDQAGHITGTTMQQTTGMPPAKELERVQPGAQVPPGNIPPPKGPERTFRNDGPMDEKMEKETEKAEENLEGELDAIAEEDLEGLEGNDVEGDKEAPR